MSDTAGEVAMCVISLVVCVVLLTMTISHEVTKSRIYRAAIESGAARWTVDRDGKTQIEWLGKPEAKPEAKP